MVDFLGMTGFLQSSMLQNNFFTLEYDNLLGYFTNILYILMRNAVLPAKNQKYTMPDVENNGILPQIFGNKCFTSLFFPIPAMIYR